MQKIDLDIIDIEKKLAGRAPGVIGDYESYSVLVPIVKKDNELNLLFEVRSPGLSRQPGEICFPGGKMEPGETCEECALRETAEELGVGLGAIRLISRLDTIYTYSNFTLHSCLGEIDIKKLSVAKMNKKEVASIFYIPITDIIKSEPFIYKIEVQTKVGDDFPYEMLGLKDGYNWNKGVHEVPIYKFGEAVIWGLTARIVYNLVKILKG